MNSGDWHIVKVGGSLLARPTLAADLRAWLDSPAASGQIVLLVGGGRFVDALRDYDELHQLGEHFAHRIAIALMDYSGEVLLRLMPELKVVHSPSQCEQEFTGPPLLLLASSWLHNEEPGLSGNRLKVGWQVTSDSIAARVAEKLQAERLTLLKSTPPPPE